MYIECRELSYIVGNLNKGQDGTQLMMVCSEFGLLHICHAKAEHLLVHLAFLSQLIIPCHLITGLESDSSIAKKISLRFNCKVPLTLGVAMCNKQFCGTLSKSGTVSFRQNISGLNTRSLANFKELYQG